MALVPFPSKGAKSAPERDPDDWDDEEAAEESGGKMSFLDHLDELRRRIMWALASVVVGFGIAIFFYQQLFNFVIDPMRAMVPKGQTLIFTEPTEAMMIYIWIAVIAGAAFAHYYAFPLTFKFFGSFSSDVLTYMPRIEPTFSLYMKLVLIFAAIFQMPTVVALLARLGLVTARFMWRNFKYALLGIFIIGAVLSPGTDPVGQIAMAGPMVVLYIISIFFAWIFGKKKKTEAEEA